MQRLIRRLPAILALLLPAGGVIGATFTASGPTTEWKVVSFGSNYPDPVNDQQTGSAEGDIVGNRENPCLYTAFGDGMLGFRFRISEQKSPPGYGECVFLGLDLGRKGKPDFFLGIDNSGSGAKLGIWGAGSGANTSPSTTTIANTPLFSYPETTLNYSWMLVSAESDPTATMYDLDGGGGGDRFISFVLPFADVLQAANTLGFGTFGEQTMLGYVAATATQPNSLNQDIVGVGGGVNSSATWLTLGGISEPLRPDTSTIPEPGGGALVLSAAVTFLTRKKRTLSK